MTAFTPASPPTLGAFLAIVVGVLAALAVGTYSGYRRLGDSVALRKTGWTMLGVILWLSVLGGIVATGYPRLHPMPGVPILVALILASSLAFAYSPVGGRISASVPVQFLVLFQAFRLPLELVLHSLAEQGVIPGTMTWSGQNFDIVVGILSLILFPFAGRFPAVARIATLIGLASLVNVTRVAIMSSPLPFAWGVEPPLQLLANLPYALIGPVCVGGALIGHLLAWRAIDLGGKRIAATAPSSFSVG